MINRSCSVCRHPQRTAIETALNNGQAADLLAEKFFVSKDWMKEHRNHMNAVQVSRVNQDPMTLMRETDEVLEEAWELLNYSKGVLAEDGKGTINPKGWAMAIREIGRLLEHKAKMMGAYDSPDPRFQKAFAERIVHVVTVALEKYPEARAMVIAAIEEVETKG